MPIIRQFSFPNNEEITTQVVDTTNNYVWVAYEQNGDGFCLLQKQNAFSPDEIYFSLEIEVDRIKSLYVLGSNLFAAYEDDTLLGQIFSTTNPLTNNTEIVRPVINENPLEVIAKNSDLFFLLPGVISGENAKVLKYNTSGIYDQEIDLNKTGEIVYDASSFSIDANNDIWVVTETAPATIVRIYELTGNIWDFEVTQII